MTGWKLVPRREYEMKKILLVALALFAVRSVFAAGVSASWHSVRDSGAIGDGAKKDTAAIQKTIDAVAAAGGGTVYFPPGKYLSGTLHMKSGVRLYIDFGATLLGSAEPADYPNLDCSYRSYTDNYVRQTLIWGENLHDIGIAGHGTIDGQGAAFAKLPWLQRPYIIRFVLCQNVTVEDVTLQNSPMWMEHYLACDNVVVRGIRVYNHVAPNNDMIDIDCCRDVRISDCMGDSDDDGLTLKSTADRPCENVVITNCVLASHCNPFKMGTESNGGFKNVTVTNCAIRQSANASYRGGPRDGLAGIALEIVDGGTLDQVVISNVAITGVSVPVFLRLGNRARPYKADMAKPAMGKLRNVILSDIVASHGSPSGCSITGMPDQPIENVTLSNIRMSFLGGGGQNDVNQVVPELPEKYPESGMFGRLPSYGLYCRHVVGLSLRNVELSVEGPEHRPALVCDDVTNLHVDQLRVTGVSGAPAQVVFKSVRQAMIRGCAPTGATMSFLQLLSNCEFISAIGNDFSSVKTPFLFDGTPQAALYAKDNRRSR